MTETCVRGWLTLISLVVVLTRTCFHPMPSAKFRAATTYRPSASYVVVYRDRVGSNIVDY